MKITLNSINAVTGVIANDEPLRQGNVGANTLTAVFEGKSNLAYTATFNYTRSDDGRLKDIPMTPTANAGEYYYKFSNPWFFAVYGETTLTVYLKNASNEIVASGQITFSIEQTDFDDDPNITYSEYELLLDALTAKQNKFEIYNVRGYDSLALAEADDDLDEYQIVIVRGNPTKIYQKGGGELHPLDSVGAYLPLSGGTMSGAISQPVAPVVDDDLANKKYVDDEVAPVAEDIAHILDGSLTVHQAYHTYMDIYGRNLVDLAKTSDLTDGTITVDKATKDANGNVIPTYYQPKLTFDDTPTTSSTKPVTSDGIKSFVDGRVQEIGIIGPGYGSLLELVNNETSSSGVFNVSRYEDGGPKPVYMLKWGNKALTIESGAIKYFQKGGSKWVLYGTYALTKDVGASLALNSTNFVLALKNSAGTTLSSVDLPLESVVVSGSYDEATQSIILTLQNGTEITIPVADLVDGLVPNTRTIAGVDLADDIIASELKTALSLVSADVGFDNTIKNFLIATNLQEAVDEVSEKVADIEAVIPASATALNPLTAKSEVVKIMPAPASTTLTDDQIAQITSGVHMEGSFLGYTNPVFFPSILDLGYYVGMVIVGSAGLPYIMSYIIDDATKKIVLSGDHQRQIYLKNIANINGKALPAYPSNTGQFDFSMIDGTLTWKDRIYEYANMYLSNNATAVSLTADTLTKFAIPMTGGASSGITISTADDNLTILKTGIYQVIVTFNTSVSVNDLTLEAGVYKNISTAIPELKQIRTAKNASTIDTSTLQGIVSLTANDVIDVRVKADGNCDMTVINATISVRRIS